MNNDIFSVSGKVVLITGGARGIGAMLSESFIKAGATVIISSRNSEKCDKYAEELSLFGSCVSMPADLSSISNVDALYNQISKSFNSLDVIINNSGTTWGSDFEEFPEKGWDKVFSLNMKAPFYLIQKFLPLLEINAKPEDPGRVINIGSVDGIRTSNFSNYSYSALKAGIHHLSGILADLLAHRNITVNCIAPGPFKTDMMQPMVEKLGLSEIVSTVPLKRLGQADDIGGVAIFLSSKASAFINGVVLPVDGGMSISSK
mgnify:CR=1 FL=1